MTSARIRKILIYRCGTIGDTIVLVPALNLIRKQFQGANLALMTAHQSDGKIWADEVLRDYHWFDEFITYTSSDLRKTGRLLSLLQRIRFFNPDLILHISSDKNSGLRILRDRLFFLFAGVFRFLPFYSSKVTFLGKLKTEDRIYPKEVERFVSGLKRIGIDSNHISFDLPIRKDHVRKVSELVAKQLGGTKGILVGMCPWSKQPSKRWPIERFANLGRRIIEDFDARILIVGGEDEARVGGQIAQAWPAGKSAVLAGKLGILETAELLRRCLFYVGNDTGAMHLAAAVGTPCVAIFSAKDPPESWHPFGNNHAVLRKNVPCRNCYLTECVENKLRCLTEISVDEVFEACKTMMDENFRRD